MTHAEQTILAALNAASGAIKILGLGMISGIGAEGKQEVLAQIEVAKALLRTPSPASAGVLDGVCPFCHGVCDGGMAGPCDYCKGEGK